MNIILSKECLGLGCSPVIESLPSMREGQSSILQTNKQTETFQKIGESPLRTFGLP